MQGLADILGSQSHTQGRCEVRMVKMDNLAFGFDHDNKNKDKEGSEVKSLLYRVCISQFLPQPSPRALDTREKIHIYKNVLLISISFLLLFTAYESMSKLQSSINSVGALIAARYEYCDGCVWLQVANLGTWSNSAVYASLILSSCFLPSLLIRRLGVKWSLVLSVLCYSFYIAAQFYPEFYTLVPTAVVLGMGRPPSG